MVYYNPYMTGEYNPLFNLNNQGFFIAQLVIAIFQLYTTGLWIWKGTRGPMATACSPSQKVLVRIPCKTHIRWTQKTAVDNLKNRFRHVGPGCGGVKPGEQSYLHANLLRPKVKMQNLGFVWSHMDVSEDSGASPQIIPFVIGDFHDFHHPFWGTFTCNWPTLWKFKSRKKSKLIGCSSSKWIEGGEEMFYTPEI